MLYVWKEYKANVSGTVIKRVTCEKCSCKYAYELVRSARGGGTSVYLLDNAGAEDRARARANKRLRRQLEHGIDPVGCPDCGWYQADMVKEAKRRMLRPLVPIAAILLALAGAYAMIGGMLLATSTGPGDATISREPWVHIGTLAGAGVLALAIRQIVVSRTDPNRGYPNRPPPYPGAPVGHKVEAAPVGPTPPPRTVQAAAAVGAYPTPPPRALKPSSKAPRRAPGAG